MYRFSVVMIGMIQPLLAGLPPIRLFAFGSDNRFTAVDVKNRLFYIKEQLLSVGIEVLTYSTDGDSREMKLMREMLQLGSPTLPAAKGPVKRSVVSRPVSIATEDWSTLGQRLRRRWPFFACEFRPPPFPTQDHVHLLTKLRTRFLKYDQFMPFGNKVATPAHIQSMMNIFSKDHHNIREGDLLLHDKMNYDAAKRLCSPKVRELLKSIPG